MTVERKILSYVYTGEDFHAGYAKDRMGTSPTPEDYDKGIDHVLVRDSTGNHYWIHNLHDYVDWDDVEDAIVDMERQYGET